MAQTRLPTEIIWVAKQGGSIRHISDGDPMYDLDDTLCGRNVWPAIPKDNWLGMFNKCKHCTRIFSDTLDKLITQAENNGFEVLTRRGGEKA